MSLFALCVCTCVFVLLCWGKHIKYSSYFILQLKQVWRILKNLHTPNLWRRIESGIKGITRNKIEKVRDKRVTDESDKFQMCLQLSPYIFFFPPLAEGGVHIPRFLQACDTFCFCQGKEEGKGKEGEAEGVKLSLWRQSGTILHPPSIFSLNLLSLWGTRAYKKPL